MTATSRTTPYLPLEIIDEILRDERLDDCDLASCCLVCRTWIGPARESLYDRLLFHVPEHEDLFPESSFWLAPFSPHHLDTKSSQLFTTLLSNRALGFLVSFIELSEARRERCQSECQAVWMRPEEVVANLTRLCPHTKALDLEDSGSFLGICINTARVGWTDVEQIRVGFVTTQSWEQLCCIETLRSLTLCTCDSPFDALRIPDPPTKLTELHIHKCASDTFETIQPTISHSLRNLGVPTDAVQCLRLSQFPKITSLTLYEGGMLMWGDSDEFLEGLSALKSLENFALSERVLQKIVPPEEKLGHFLPPSCHRVDLFRCRHSESIASVVQQSRSGSRIRQLGLLHNVKDKKGDRIEALLAATRALLEAANVELVWRG